MLLVDTPFLFIGFNAIALYGPMHNFCEFVLAQVSCSVTLVTDELMMFL